MTKVTNLDIKYAGLMSHNPEGTYLYIPPSFAKLHPGSVGFFDQRGSWNQITDLSQKGRSQADGYTTPSQDLSHGEPITSTWKVRSSEPEDGQQTQLNGGISDHRSADVNCESKPPVTSSGKAGLAIGGATRREKIWAPFFNPASGWASENIQALLSAEFATHIEKNGLWIIQSTWVAEQCAIHMTDRADKSVEAGFDVVSKSGNGSDSFEKLEKEGWSTYRDEARDGGLVVSFSGLHFKPSQSQKFENDVLHKDGLVGEIDFESVMVGQTRADAEEEREAEEIEDEKTKAEAGARKTAIHRNTEVSDDAVPH